MQLLEKQLKQRRADLPGAVDPATSVAGVVARGRRRLWLVRAASGLGTAAVLATAAVAVPQLLDSNPELPTILGDVEPGPTEKGSKVGDGDIDEPVTSVEVGTHKDSTSQLDPEAGKWVSTRDATASSEDAKPSESTSTDEMPAKAAPTTEPAVEKDAPTKPAATTFTATQHNDQMEYDPPYAKYSGTAPAGTKITISSPYGGTQTKADASGHWAAKVWFETAPYGTHVWTVVVESSDGERTTFEFMGTRPQQSSVAFTASQKYGSSSETPPFDVFWGTAKPGSDVHVVSEYGSGYTTANVDGGWELRVEFPSAPRNTPFHVKAKSAATGERIVFEFVATSDSRGEGDTTFSATQLEDSTTNDPPYAHYKGTAPAGTLIDVGSPYGTASTKAGADGTWQVKVWFEDAPYGTHTWTVVVESSNGDRTTFEFTGTRPEPAQSSFTAKQLYGSSDDSPPFDVFYGTADPGSKIRIESAYGGGFAYANSAGDWEVKVEFPEAPTNESFPVYVISDATGEKIELSFTRLA